MKVVKILSTWILPKSMDAVKNRSGFKQISTTLGTITIRTHSVRKSKQKNSEGLHVCGAKKCSKCLKNSTLMSRINIQMWNTHAGFVTDHLNRMEVNANVKFHTYPPQHFCEYCDRGFHFNSELTVHKKLHTKKDLIPCTGCTKQFTCNRYMKEHAKSTCGPG